MCSAVLSVRIRRGLREEAERLGVNIREVVEKALEEEVKRVKMGMLRNLFEEALRSMNISVEDWVMAVRESRLER
jgi:hypothetical protein